MRHFFCGHTESPMTLRAIILTLLFASFSASKAQTIMVVSPDTVVKIINSLPDSGTVVINFWATWCRPCVEELPYFIKADTMLKGENTTFIFVSFDMASRVETVGKFVSKQKMPGAHFLVNVTNEMNEFIEKVDPKWEGVIPYTIVLTHEGRKNHEGSFASFRELWGFIRN